MANTFLRFNGDSAHEVTEGRGVIYKSRQIELAEQGRSLAPALHSVTQRLRRVILSLFEGFEHEALSGFIREHYADLGLSYDIISVPALLEQSVQSAMALLKSDLSRSVRLAPSTGKDGHTSSAQLEWLTSNSLDLTVFLKRALYHRFYLNALSLARVYNERLARLEASKGRNEVDPQQLQTFAAAVRTLRERAALIFSQAQVFDRSQGFEGEGLTTTGEHSLVADLALFGHLGSDSASDVPAPLDASALALEDLEKGERTQA